MTGLTGGRCVMPPKPRSPAVGASPDRKPLRSMPALKVPPAPVSTRTLTSGPESNSSMAAATPRATSPLTAFLASGRLMVMTAMPPLTSVRTASDIGWGSLLRLEANAAVEANYLGVHVIVLDECPRQLGELGRRSHP